MRLTKIKLAGFKSFVDPTTFNIPGQLLAVVGPNGCGKSNIIDAVRWVMGESAASQLRGDSMEDVIFNGSVDRKPVGQASVELVFDNSDRKLEGAWGQYNEVAVKRVVARGAQSSYYINNTRCRRRDISAIFLGTGLGPRSYAIIEQGTISRIIESKPDELRVFFEEAAGISKYKERRRETATRIRHTEENLTRLNDLREEQGKQLAHLQRQARNAEKFKEYRAEERTLKAQLLALRWRALNDDAASQERLIRERETRLESLVAEQRRLELRQTAERSRHVEVADALAAAQETHYRVGAEIVRTEQTLEHRRQLRERRQVEQIRIEQGLERVRGQTEIDRQRLDELAEQTGECEILYEEAQAIACEADERLGDAEQALADWQARWDEFAGRAGASQRAADVERVRIEQLERQQVQSQQRADRLRAEQQAFSASAADGERQLAALEQRYLDAELELAGAGETEAELKLLAGRQLERQQTLQGRLDEQRGRQQTGRGRLSSLQTLQDAALGAEDTGRARQDWLRRRGLVDAPRLADLLRAEPGWEAALETVLGGDLGALCVDPQRFAEAAAALPAPAQPLTLIALSEDGAGAGASADADTLAARLDWRQPGAGRRASVRAAVAGLLDGVGVAGTLDEAMTRRDGLAPGASLVTADGVWLGRHWLRTGGAGGDGGDGLLARARQIDALTAELAALDGEIGDIEAELTDVRDARARLEQERQQAQAALTAQQRVTMQLEAQREAARERLQQQHERQSRLAAEIDDQHRLLEQSQQELIGARERLEQALAAMTGHESERAALEAQRETCRGELAEARAGAADARAGSQRHALRLETLKSERAGLEQALQRLTEQRRGLLAAREELAAEAQAALDGEEGAGEGEADAALRAELETLLASRVESQRALDDARRDAEACDAELRQLERSLAELARHQQTERDALGERRLSNSETSVRRQTMRDQLLELGLTLEGVLNELPAEAGEQEWQRRLQAVGERIQRLGAINLAAIEEHQQLAERKQYLDSQHDDLVEALRTLNDAMAKIDEETRSRFKDTFDRVNDGLQTLFPRLFGGGRAYLELTGQDTLEAGVTIMAHPPGKRNGTIHLLSGGEKALTAVAMIFSIFQLNPAPFCMLDEVDAPLDDANIGRFGDLLKEMSAQVQLIVVSHNKGTMEVAAQLAGVTMHEPGVSRLVAVDIDEAVRLASA